jgi:hypothetical protein
MDENYPVPRDEARERPGRVARPELDRATRKALQRGNARDRAAYNEP